MQVYSCIARFILLFKIRMTRELIKKVKHRVFHESITYISRIYAGFDDFCILQGCSQRQQTNGNSL